MIEHGDQNQEVDAESVQIVRKRDGSIVAFDRLKIEYAVARAFESTGEGKSTQAQHVVDAVVIHLQKTFDGHTVPTIEQIQDVVEKQLMLAGFCDTAKAYVLYRAQHAANRRKQPSKDFGRLAQESRQYFHGPMSEFVYYRSYSRWIDDLGRRETWPETVQRYMDFMHENLGEKLSEAEYADVQSMILNMKTMPSMRLMWSAGKSARLNNVTAFNCAFTAPTCPRDLAEIMFLSMSGCGVGVSVESHVAQQFPLIKKQKGVMRPVHVVGDSKEGWCNALVAGLEAWFAGEDIEFDMSLVRPRGSRLMTGGGKASGPEPMRALLAFARTRILGRQRKRLRNIDLHDIICKIGEVVVAGGVRRTALISLSDLDDHEMRNSKSGQFFLHDPQRQMANNSTAYDEKPTNAELLSEWGELINSGSGERGIFNRGSLKQQMPQRRWASFRHGKDTSGVNPCITGDTLVYVADGRGMVPIKQLADEGLDIPVFCLDDHGSICVRTMRHPRQTGRRVVYKVTMDDGSSIRATSNDKLRLHNGQYCRVDQLKPKDSLFIVTRYAASIKDIFKDANSHSQDYWWVNTGKTSNHAEHRLVAEHFYNDGRKLPHGNIVHHKDRDAGNNAPQNLEVMSKEAHDILHNISGDNNPMRRAATEWSEEKWSTYKAKQSAASSGSNNTRFSGFTHDDLKAHALLLTKQLGHRFSPDEWVSYARANGLPQSFSKWRRDHLGGIRGLAIWAANHLKLEHVSIDPRVAQTYAKLTGDGYECEVIDGVVFIVKRCEWCGKRFLVDHYRREAGICSQSCSQKKQWQSDAHAAKVTEGMHLANRQRQDKIGEKQVEIYADLKFDLKRDPLKKEWATACKKIDVSSEISRKSSPFKDFQALKEAASLYNHKVVSVVEEACEDVFDGTVDEFHNYFIGGFASNTTAGKPKQVFINKQQCGEINLLSKEFCNLTEVVARADDDLESLRKKIRVAALIGTYQSTLTNFPYLSPEWKSNCDRECLLGISITGMWDCQVARDPNVLKALKDEAIKVNQEYAQRFGVNPSAAVTCVKPSGTVSSLVSSASGMHPRHAHYYIRRVRISSTDSLFAMLRDQGVPYHPEPYATIEGTYVLEFPEIAPSGAITRNDLTALDQLEHWKMVKQNYTEHNPSVTVSVGSHEWLQVLAWIDHNWDIVGGLSFLPRSDHVYELAPYEEITEERYNELIAAFPQIDYSQLSLYEHDDQTQGQKECACTGGACEI